MDHFRPLWVNPPASEELKTQHHSSPSQKPAERHEMNELFVAIFGSDIEDMQFLSIFVVFFVVAGYATMA